MPVDPELRKKLTHNNDSSRVMVKNPMKFLPPEARLAEGGAKLGIIEALSDYTNLMMSATTSA
jgi:hypothetical protein